MLSGFNIHTVPKGPNLKFHSLHYTTKKLYNPVFVGGQNVQKDSLHGATQAFAITIQHTMSSFEWSTWVVLVTPYISGLIVEWGQHESRSNTKQSSASSVWRLWAWSQETRSIQYIYIHINIMLSKSMSTVANERRRNMEGLMPESN